MGEQECALCNKFLHPFDSIPLAQLDTLGVHQACHSEHDRRMREGACMRCGKPLDDGRPVDESAGRHVECEPYWPS